MLMRNTLGSTQHTYPVGGIDMSKNVEWYEVPPLNTVDVLPKGTSVGEFDVTYDVAVVIDNGGHVSAIEGYFDAVEDMLLDAYNRVVALRREAE